MTAHSVLGHGPCARYGLLGLPLAFVAMPLYVLLPHHYARVHGLPLATLGALLLLARLADALLDPLIGRASDRLFRQSPRRVWQWAAAAALLLWVAFGLLFFPPALAPQGLLLWLALVLLVAYAAYSALGIAHQSWGAMLGGDALQRSRLTGWREGLGLAGVLLASVAPAWWGLPATVALFGLALLAGWWAWGLAPLPAAVPSGGTPSVWQPWRRADFRQLLAVFVLNGVASAVPATLVLFFVQDRLQASPALEPAFLGLYFLAAALSMPLWLRLVRRWGLARSWLAGMVLAVAVFGWAGALGPGDGMLFLGVCALSGLALGSDLALPGALLAGLIARAGDRGRAEGAYFGWWNFATKLNLALAAGLALPLLALLGYTPGTRDPAALDTLALAYTLLPCLLKAAAAAGLYHWIVRKETP